LKKHCWPNPIVKSAELGKVELNLWTNVELAESFQNKERRAHKRTVERGGVKVETNSIDD